MEACAREVAQAAKGHTIVVEKSTLPVRTAAAIKTILESASAGEDQRTFSVLSNPEFLAEGTAIRDLEAPDRVLIGGDDSAAIDALAAIYAHWVPQQILRTNLWSSELSKLTANAFGAANQLYQFDCRFLRSKWGGCARSSPCDRHRQPHWAKIFERWTRLWRQLFPKRHSQFGLSLPSLRPPEVADYWERVVSLNTWQQHRIAQLVVQKLFGTVTGKRLAILGFAFKADTNDTREAPAIRICRNLLEEGAQLVIHDPKVTADQIASDLNHDSVSQTDAHIGTEHGWATKIENSVTGSEAVLVLTEWQQYRDLNWHVLAARMRKPAWVFDARAVADPAQIKAALSLAHGERGLMTRTVLVTGAAGFIGAARLRGFSSRETGLSVSTT